MKVLFSDESKFVQIRSNSRLVRRPPKTRFDPQFTVKMVKHPASVMVWGCFDGSVGRGRLFFLPKKVTMNKERYVAMLEEKMLPIFRARGNTFFQQDKAPCHTARLVKAWMRENNKCSNPFLARKQSGFESN